MCQIIFHRGREPGRQALRFHKRVWTRGDKGAQSPPQPCMALCSQHLDLSGVGSSRAQQLRVGVGTGCGPSHLTLSPLEELTIRGTQNFPRGCSENIKPIILVPIIFLGGKGRGRKGREGGQGPQSGSPCFVPKWAQ